MPNKPTAPQPKRSLGERMFGDNRAKAAEAKRAAGYKAAAGRAAPGDQRARTPSYTDSQAADMKRRHDYILDPDGKVRRYARESKI